MRSNPEEEATLRRLVEQGYRALWTKKNGTFSIELADQLYANSDQLTAIDTDLAAIQLTPNQSTRINGYENYRTLWPRIFERVGGFEQEIQNVQVRINGTWAITTFDGIGTYTALDGKQTPTNKNFTLVWERRPEGWRIIHEHISDGR
jgi:ketosteroid isomerase-like protein